MCAMLYQAAEGHLLVTYKGGSTCGLEGKIKDMGEKSSKAYFILNLEETFQICVLQQKIGKKKKLNNKVYKAHLCHAYGESNIKL